MGLFGGGNSKKQTTVSHSGNTITTQTTTVRDIGLTGSAAVKIADNLARRVNAIAAAAVQARKIDASNYRQLLQAQKTGLATLLSAKSPTTALLSTVTNPLVIAGTVVVVLALSRRR